MCSRVAQLRYAVEAYTADYVVLQEWVASVKVPSEEATALTRMADAAAAAAAFTAVGLKHDHSMLTEQAQRAELAKRAQQASDAVLRGDSDATALQEADRRSYSRSDICMCTHTQRLMHIKPWC